MEDWITIVEEVCWDAAYRGEREEEEDGKTKGVRMEKNGEIWM